MNKKTRLALFLSLSIITINAIGKMRTPTATISFQVNNKISVKSSTALVMITVNATLMSKDTTNIQTNLLKRLNSSFPKVSWKTIDYQQRPAKSGAMNIFYRLQARLIQGQINNLAEIIRHHNLPNQNIQWQIINFKPSTVKLNQAKNQLMISIYNDIQKLAKKFNEQTQSNYQVKSVNFQTNIGAPRQLQNTMLLMDANNKAQQAQSSKNIAVAEDITMQANVVLAQVKYKQPYKTVGGMDVLPPKYLSVKGFKQCLSTKNMGTWSSWCKPHDKPENCPQSAWDALQQDDIPSCANNK